jgi:hypothetical protein
MKSCRTNKRSILEGFPALDPVYDRMLHKLLKMNAGARLLVGGALDEVQSQN